MPLLSPGDMFPAIPIITVQRAVRWAGLPRRQPVAVLDGIFDNPTNLPIAGHTTDTAGQTPALRGVRCAAASAVTE